MANDSNGQLVVVDSEYEYASQKFENYGDYLKSIINDYVIIMDYLLEYGIKDQLISNNIRAIVDEVKKNPEKTEMSLENIGIEVTTTDSDLADLYNELIDPNSIKMPWFTQQTKSVEGKTTTTIIRW